MRVLIACEESQTVCKAFRAKGHEAYSCDLKDCSGGYHEWHIKGNVIPVLNQDWDLLIAHPPCTHLATSGAKHFAKKIADGRQQAGIDFFMVFAKTNIPKVCIENPIGIMSRIWRPPDQIFHPYHFGHNVTKSTCIWLKNLPKLTATHYDAPLFGETVDVGEFHEFVSKKGVKKKMSMFHYSGFVDASDTEDRMVRRSFRFPLVAKAMAEQWG